MWTVPPRRESSSGALRSKTRVAAEQESSAMMNLLHEDSRMRKLLIIPGVIAGLVAARSEARPGPDAAVWQQTVDKAVAYLKKSQDPAGSWSGDRSPGVTGIVLTGLLKTG